MKYGNTIKQAENVIEDDKKKGEKKK